MSSLNISNSYSATYYQKHKDKFKKLFRKNYEEHKEEYKDRAKKYYLKNKNSQEFKDKRNKNNRNFSLTAKGIYKTLKQNSKRHKRELKLTQEEFCDWFKKQIKECYYCNIPINKIDYLPKNPNGRIVKRLTIDRVNNNLPYQINNIVLACYICNHIKSFVFNNNEMKQIAQLFIKPKWEEVISS